MNVSKHTCRAGLAILAALSPSLLPAQGHDHDGFRLLLSEGRVTEAAERADAALALTPDDPLARFDLGAAQFLLAVETLGQGLHRHGLRSSYSPGMGMLELPFLRLPIPENPAPEPVTYEALRGILARFQQDLALAEATLADVGGDVAFDAPLDLGTIRLDFDGDGQGSEEEHLLAVLGAVSPRVGSDTGFLVDFDQSDAPWLQGYTHLLSAMADFLLAHDWEQAFQTSFHGLFPDTEMPGSRMNAEVDRVLDRLEALVGDGGRPGWPELPPDPQQPPQRSDESWSDYRERLAEYHESEAYRSYVESEAFQKFRAEWQRFEEVGRLEASLQYASIADLIAFVHLFSWDVVEPERMASARGHLLSMIDLSRENWVRIRAETDDKREWVPAPTQSGIFQRMRITEETVANWHLFLDEFEAVLEGERLLAHWRFAGRGINLRRMFEEPTRFDPWLIGHGSAVIPYLEEGDIVTGDMAGTMLELFGGDFFAYFIWFN